MKPSDLRAFARRSWAAAEQAKVDYWAELLRSAGTGPATLAADALRLHAARFAGLGDDADRADDLAHHVSLKRRLDAASRRIGR